MQKRSPASPPILLVKTRDGYRPMEKIEIGDEVLSWNEETKVLSYSKVTSTSARPTHDIFVLQYSDGTEIETTWNHPFYIQDKGWVEVKDLEVGDLSLTSGDTVLEITGIRMKPAPQTVYNIHLDKDHTYFVTDSDVLVHNYSPWQKGMLGVVGVANDVLNTANVILEGREAVKAAGEYRNARAKFFAQSRSRGFGDENAARPVGDAKLKALKETMDIIYASATLSGTPGGGPRASSVDDFVRNGAIIISEAFNAGLLYRLTRPMRPIPEIEPESMSQPRNDPPGRNGIDFGPPIPESVLIYRLIVGEDPQW